MHSNRTLSNIQKLHYLKTSLKEEPARLLSQLQLSNANYEVAFKILEDRYGNKRMITHTPRADPRFQAAEAGLAPTVAKVVEYFR